MTATTDPQVLLDSFLDPASRSDPYPVLARIRSAGPLVLPQSNLTVFSTFADCDEVLRHPSSACDRLKSTVAQRELARGAARASRTPAFLFLDPPDHTRLRMLVSKAFVPKVVKGFEPEIVALVDELLDKVVVKGELEVIEDLAHPLPVAVICRLLGVPLADEPAFSRASALSAQSLDPFDVVTGRPADGEEDRLQAGLWLSDYLRELITERRVTPRADLISGLIAAEDAGDQLTEDEIVATCVLLLIAGHETTVNLIANATLAMLHHPAQWAALASDSDRAAVIAEESLRYDPPVQLVGRIAAETMRIGEVSVAEGDDMLLLTAAAGRDAAAFDRPDAFDPDRARIRHLGFGKGPHFCLGAPLARLEAAVALRAVTRRFPTAELAGEPVYKPNVTLRGMESLSVSI